MNDKPLLSSTFIKLLAGAALLSGASAANAGDAVLYEGLPSWVEEVDFSDIRTDKPVQHLLFDAQYRLENGVVSSYVDSAVQIATPDMLTQHGTIALTWYPDKGDIAVHRVEILRDGKAIDVLAGGARFEVLRREQGLEQRLLDGQLTATMVVPGLKVGDIMRITHSMTLADQALGSEMQATQLLPESPWQVGKARAIVSWPDGSDVVWRGERLEGVAKAALINGYRRLEVPLPLAKSAEMPFDAPWRFRRPSVLRVGTFQNWQEMSRVLYPHFRDAAVVGPGSDVSVEAAKIMRATADPLERAALALRLVQDQVSYLLNGLDGGNYLPQTAGETWKMRYGDCKAKTVLLVGILREMGIEASPVLVATRGGDALPELLPIPADFDHMIARATINGVDYWLDGTTTGTRMTNIAEVPPFYHALPLSEAGSDLAELPRRPKPHPDMVMTVDSDYTAGLDLPYLFDIDIELFGAQGAGLRTAAKQANPALLAQLARNFTQRELSGSVVSHVALDYDEQRAVGKVRISGVSNSEFEWKDGRLQSATSQEQGSAEFDADRARPEWREIPLASGGSSRTKVSFVTHLPKSEDEFTLAGLADLDTTIGTYHIRRNSRIENGQMLGEADISQQLGEIAPADLPEIRRAARRLASNDVRLVAPVGAKRKWEFSSDELRKRSVKLVAALNAAVGRAEADDWVPLNSRAAFFASIYDYQRALTDYDRLIAVAPSSSAHVERAAVLLSLGRGKDAAKDLTTAYDLEPDNAIAFQLAELLAYEGRQDEALVLLEGLPVGDDDRVAYADSLATVSGLDGNTDVALDTLARAVAEKPQNASILNSDCWFRGLFNVALTDAMDRCTRAVERAENAAPALDSRAMVRFRRGEYDAALVDLDAALALSPGLAASRYLRGIVRLEKGEQRGRDDIAAALRMQPELAAKYARHGVKPRD